MVLLRPTLNKSGNNIEAFISSNFMSVSSRKVFRSESKTVFFSVTVEQFSSD